MMRYRSSENGLTDSRYPFLPFFLKNLPFILPPADIEALSEAYDDVVIDAPPTNADVIKAALGQSDLAIIPVSPGSLDLWACTDTLKMIEAVRVQHPELEVKFLVNRKISGTRTAREIRGALKDFGTIIMDAKLCRRIAYVEAMKYGVSVMQFAPGSKAADEIEQLCDEIEQLCDEIVNGADPGGSAEVIGLNPIEEIYQEETDNILFRSFQGL